MQTLQFTVDNKSFQVDQFHSMNQGYEVMFWSWQKDRLQYIPVGDFRESLHINTAQIRFHTMDNKVKREGRGAVNHKNTVTKPLLPAQIACFGHSRLLAAAVFPAPK